MLIFYVAQAASYGLPFLSRLVDFDRCELWFTYLPQSRNLANLIWIHVPTDRSAKAKTPLPKDAQLRVIIEKRSMINLVQAFSASVKV
jgi:hypothetical protein